MSGGKYWTTTYPNPFFLDRGDKNHRLGDVQSENKNRAREEIKMKQKVCDPDAWRMKEYINVHTNREKRKEKIEKR